MADNDQLTIEFKHHWILNIAIAIRFIQWHVTGRIPKFKARFIRMEKGEVIKYTMYWI